MSTSIEKLNEVLTLFTSPDYNVVSPTYVDLLLTHISDIEKGSPTTALQYKNVFDNWIIKAFDIWDGKTIQPSIMTFVLKLIGLIAKDEPQFIRWEHASVFDKVSTVFDLDKTDLSVSVKVAFVTMLSNILHHYSGRQWIIKSGIWMNVVKYAQLNQTMYVSRESQNFLNTLLMQEQHNVELCKEIILAIGMPLTMNHIDNDFTTFLENGYSEKNNLLCNTLDLITNVYENALFTSFDNDVPKLFEVHIDLEMRVKALFETCISTKLLPHVDRLLLLCVFFKLKQGMGKPGEIVDQSVFFDKFLGGISYMSMMLLSKKAIPDLLKQNKLIFIFWNKMYTLREFKTPLPHKLEHQPIVLMVVPLCVCIKLNYMRYDLFELFVDKIFNITCPIVQRFVYNTRDIIRKENLPLEQICKISIGYLIELSDIMNRDIAVITFQILCHVLQNFLPIEEDSKSNEIPKKLIHKSILEGDPIVEAPILLASLLDGLMVITEKFKLTWQECVETISLLSLAEGILNHTGVSTLICIKALKICKLAINNFMPPNLILLVSAETYSNELGKTLFKRLHDANWEIQDSVLEILNTIAEISEHKFLPYQEFILKHGFIDLAVDLINNKNIDSYTRGSALIFVSTTVRIDKLWDRKLSQMDLPHMTMKLLDEETEGIVRRHAVSLLTELYIHRKWSKMVKDNMSQVMSRAAVFDLHWEVKVNALEYWKQVIKSRLSDQGMMDGVFPTVIFSKEHRKIVKLDEKQIKHSVYKVLDELAQQRCLGVLLVTLRDESDFEVCKTSAKITNDLKQFLLKYKLDEPLPKPSSPHNSAVIDEQYIRPSPPPRTMSSEKSSDVIDEIVNSNDANLLASMYNNSLKMDESPDGFQEKTLKYMSSITREEFLQTIFNTNIEALIEEKDRWLKTNTNSFESTLDDILTKHKEDGVNVMDCY